MQQNRAQGALRQLFALDQLQQALRFDHSRDFKLQLNVANEGARDELIKLNKEITAHLVDGAKARDSFAHICSDRLQYYRRGEPILSKNGSPGFLEHLDQLKLATPPTHEIIEVTFLGRLALVNASLEFKPADAAATRTRDVRIFARAKTGWLLETWCSNVPHSAK